MVWKFNLVVIVLALFAGSAGAQTPLPEIIEETDTYRMYADGSIELKLVDPAVLEAIRAAEFENRLQKQDTQTTSAGAAGTLEENAVPGLWKGFGGVPYGCNGDINVIEKGPDGKIYLGGSFSACNDVIVNNIAAWDPATNTFLALGMPAGVDNRIRDMAFAPNGDLIVVGDFFRRAGNISVDSVVRWDGSNWSQVGQDHFNSTIVAVEIDPATGNIYVGGFFDQIFLNSGGLLQVNRIAVWNGADWSGLGDGFNSTVNSLQFGGGILYAGGSFSQSGTLPVNNVAAWDGTQWTDVGGGTDNTVVDLTTDGVNLLAGGFFSNAGGVSTGSIARWDGMKWSSIDGPTCCFGDMYYAAGKLFVTGGFSSVDGVFAPRVAIWDGASWSGTADSSAFNGNGNSIFSDGEDIFLGYSAAVIGTFGTENFPDEGLFANRIVRFDSTNQQWMALGSGVGNAPNGPIVSILAFESEILVAGRFQSVGQVPVNGGIASWDGQQWGVLDGNPPCGSIRDMVASAEIVFATTSCFSTGGSEPVNWTGTARWDGLNWDSVGGGFDNQAQAVAADDVTGNIFYGGSFTATREEPEVQVNRTARWDGFEWSSVGEGAENGVSNATSSFASVRSLAAKNGQVMTEGFFDRAGTIEVEGFAVWDGSAWGVPGDGLNNVDSSPFIGSLESQGNSVFAAGLFTRSGSQQLRNIAEWNGTSWVPLQGAVGEGVGFIPRALHATPVRLFVGGDFVEAGGRPAQRIARWDGEDWRSLGAGSENGLGRADAFFSPIDAMQATADGIFVGGFFGGSNAVFSPNLIRFVPMENLDLAIDAEVTGIAVNQVNYEITIVNNGEFALVDSSLLGNWSPEPTSVSWTCTPVPPATRGCTQSSGIGGLNQILEVPAGATVRFEVIVDADVSASPFLDFNGTWSAAPVEGATGITEDSVVLQTAVASEGVFKDGFEG